MLSVNYNTTPYSKSPKSVGENLSQVNNNGAERIIEHVQTKLKTPLL
jgi:hypothetical protein